MTVVAPPNGWALETSQPLSRAPYPSGPPDTRPSEAETRLAQQVVTRWEQGAQLLSDARRSYYTNLAFYLGHHWLWWSDVRSMVMPMPVEWSPIGKGKARVTVNRFGTNITNVLARLTNSGIAFEVAPTDSGDAMVGGARLGEDLLEAAKRDGNWESVRFDENLAKLLGGTSAVSIEWDGKAGQRIQMPVYDERTTQYVGTGDARLRAHNITEFIIEPGVREQGDARWWMSALAMPVGTIRDHYNLSYLPVPDAEVASGSLYSSLLDNSGRLRGETDLAMVYTFYERPWRDRPGMYVVVCGNRVLYKSRWPFPFEHLNLRVFRQRRIDGKWFGGTYADDGRPIQIGYNHARSVVQEYMKHIAKMRLAAPMGAFNQEDLDAGPDKVLFYAADMSGQQPGYVTPPALSRTITDEPGNLAAELDTVMHVSDVSKGIGYSRAAAQALQFLATQDDSGLSPMVNEEKAGWEAIGKMYLELMGANVTETRTTELPLAKSVTRSLRWTGRQLQGQTRVVVPLDSVQPQNAAANAAAARDLWDKKIITDPRLFARMSGLPPAEFEQLMDPDAALANTENLRMAQGIPVLPNDFDDHAQHIAEHNDRMRKTDAYLFASPEVRSIVDDHIAWHEKKAANEQARQNALGQVNPAYPGVPQGDAPVGSEVPMGEEEAQAVAGRMAALGAAPDGSAMGGAPAINQAPSRPALPGG